MIMLSFTEPWLALKTVLMASSLAASWERAGDSASHGLPEDIIVITTLVPIISTIIIIIIISIIIIIVIIIIVIIIFIY